MLAKVRAYIQHEIGLDDSALVFVALSGGADSTALLLILKELGYRLHALHCNFHLRGEESDDDQRFVEELCRQNDVPLSVRHFDTAAEAKRRGISIEMAARELRYDWFREMVKSPLSKPLPRGGEASAAGSSPSGEVGRGHVAVAHHQDDQAETLLLNLLRGTGLRGLGGMSPTGGEIIRPLLCLRRSEIIAFLQKRGQPYVVDSTNSERTYQRNHLRLDVMPLLESINPKAVDHLCRACENVRQSIPFYNQGVQEAFREQSITESSFPLAALASRTLLHEWLEGKGFNAAQEEEMTRSAGGQTGKTWTSERFLVLRDRSALVLSEKSLQPTAPELIVETVTEIGQTDPSIAYFDADLLPGPISVRAVRNGDSFVPFGMKGRKLISDFLTDIKLSRIEKQHQFVAVHGDDIIWLIGRRSDNRFRVTPGTTRILKVSVAPR